MINGHSKSSVTHFPGFTAASGVICASTAGLGLQGLSDCVVGGFVGATSTQRATNAILYAGTSAFHMATRDLRDSAQHPSEDEIPLGLSLDTSTGRIAWQSLAFNGAAADDIDIFSITSLALHSTARRQSASVGGVLYLAGAPVQAYDGGALGEAGFVEVPTIDSIASNTSGSLANGATYSYVVHFEYTLSDGTFFRSPPSLPFEFQTDDAGEDGATLSVQGPHSQRVVLAAAYFGSQITGVVSRTIWDAANSSQGSLFHEVLRFDCPASSADYGDAISVAEGLSDTDAATRAVLYTQGGRVEDNAPGMATYLSASSSRLICAGLARQSEAQDSKELQLDQGVHISGLSAFF